MHIRIIKEKPQYRIGSIMIELKQMPYREKLQDVKRLDKLVEEFASTVVKNELGEKKLAELQNIWEMDFESVSAKASEEEKYEVAYKNFILRWVSANNIMRKYDGEHGTAKYMQAAIEAWKRQYSLESFLLKIDWRLSPKSAFKSLAKKLAYRLQVFSPFTVTELDQRQMTLAVNPCKILGVPDGIDFCVMACQNIIPSWLEAQFNVKMIHNREGMNCTMTFAPF